MGQTVGDGGAVDRAGDRLERLVAIAGRLSTAGSTEAVSREVVDASAEELSAQRVAVMVVDESGDQLRMIATAGVDPLVVEVYGDVDVAADLPASEVVRTGELFVTRSRAELDRRYPVLADVPMPASMVVAPLRAPDGSAVGILSIGFAEEGREVDAPTMQFIQGLADMCAQALHRIRVEDQLREVLVQQRFLADAGALLISSLDPTEVMDQVARLAVPAVADICAVCLGDGDALRVAAIAHADPDRQPVVEHLAARSEMVTHAGLIALWREGEATVTAEVDWTAAVAAAEDAEHRSLLSALEVTSALAAPLVAREQRLGVLILMTTTSDRRLGPTDLALAEDLAGRAALSLANARMHSDRLELTENLERALRNRVVVEQAKGVLAARLAVTPDEAFEPLRAAARARRQSVYLLAEEVLRGAVDVAERVAGADRTDDEVRRSDVR